MLINQAYRYELKPNNVQETLLAKHAGTARFAWNWALAQNNNTNAIAQHREWNVWKRENVPWWTEISKCVPQEAFRDLDRAFSNFFSIWREAKTNPSLRARIARSKPRKDGKPYGYPKFKKKGVHDSFHLRGAVHVKESHVQLPRLGTIRVKENTNVQGRILSVTVSREADRWFVSLSVEREKPDPIPISGPIIGIDLGLDCFATLSNGEHIYAPKPLNKSLKRLKRASKKHSRKQKGSNNRRKSAMRLARLHRTIRNQRRDFLHQVTTKLAKTKSVIVVEDLNVKGMVRNGRLSRHISDVGWGEFQRMLDYKTKWCGSHLVTADRWFPSSRMCSTCGYVIDELPLSVRRWMCPVCKVVHNRDDNASLNLEHYYTTGSSPGSHACGDSSGGGTDAVWSTSYGSRKQEANTDYPAGIKG
ncbi:MAG: RNA-guided endonuclease InsQ/TnpB family protein [Dehalococcoidia bacterium]